MRQKTQAGPEDSSERKSRDAQDKKCIFKRQSWPNLYKKAFFHGILYMEHK